MGMFFADDRYDESRRMEGFGRYKQLLSFYAGRWVKVNLLTVLGPCLWRWESPSLSSLPASWC